MTGSHAKAPRPLTPVTFHILVTLGSGPAYGYEIKRQVEDRTDGAVRLGAGTLYAGIQRMVDDDLIEATDPPADVEATEVHGRSRFYALTDHGRRVLADEVARLERDLTAARAVLRGNA